MAVVSINNGFVSRERQAVMISKNFFSIGLIVIILLCTGLVQEATASSKARVQVSATVSPWFKAQAIQQIGSYQVTREDIARGYTDLTAAVTVQFQSNINQGQIVFQVANFAAEQVLVKQGGMVNDQIFIATIAGSPPEQRSYDLRVILSPEIVAGIYPLHLSMQTTLL
jgi:hypothetical protein